MDDRYAHLTMKSMELLLGCRKAEVSELCGANELACTLHYLAEGGANAVFTIEPWSPEISLQHPVVFFNTQNPNKLVPPPFDRVLRVNKGNSSQRGQDIKRQFDQAIRPLFAVEGQERFLMEHEPVALLDGMIDEIRKELDHHESTELGRRPKKRHGDEIPSDENMGLLMTNMCAVPGISITMELKPKWLEQSPNAPRYAYRCRSCALRAQRHSKENNNLPDAQSTLSRGGEDFCPLDLITRFNAPISGADSDVFPSYLHRQFMVHSDYAALPKEVQVTIVSKVHHYLSFGDGQTVLSRLESIQRDLDPYGVLVATDLPTNPFGQSTNVLREHVRRMLRVVMTVRDCSMFIRVPLDIEDPKVELRLADLDLKAAEKEAEWAAKEQSLLNGGWYLGKEKDAVPEKVCLRSRVSRTRIPWYW